MVARLLLAGVTEGIEHVFEELQGVLAELDRVKAAFFFYKKNEMCDGARKEIAHMIVFV